jgi:hypothetical protein
VPGLRKSVLFTYLSVAGLLLSLFTSYSAPALTFNSAPATLWGALYAAEPFNEAKDFNSVGETSTTTSGDLPQPRSGVSKSRFEITYVNIPDRAKPAIEKGVKAWESVFESEVPVRVVALWDRTAPFGVLGTARPGRYFNGFSGAPDSDLWYASALANALAGRDLDPVNPEIVIRLNSLAFWYYGIDERPGANQYDLASVVLHEIGHGVGFLSNADYITFNNFGTITQPTPFDAYAQLPDGRRLMDLPSPSQELGSAMTNTLYWSGSAGIQANLGEKPLLYTPKTFEVGSSVSHLDEKTFPKNSIDATMTPNLEAGEVLRAPGPIAEAMIVDMKQKPPAPIAFGIPSEPRNVRALIGDKRLIITFDPPANARSAQVSSYIIRNQQTGAIVETENSPVVISGLKNKTQYSFEIIAVNVNGRSPAAKTESVAPESGWDEKVIDARADGKFIAAATFQGQKVLAYTDSKSGDVKLARYSNNRWKISTVDGNATSGGRTRSDLSGYLSLCVSGQGAKERLHLFYTDLTDKDLRYGQFDGKKWRFEIVDGNGPIVQNYQEKVRVRTASDVSVSNACAATSAGLQVFYRDESQGILLGAVRSRNTWIYEIVDGDKKTEGRTLGDVGFRLRATTVSDTVYLLYDSILVVDQNRDATQGEVRLATRKSIYPEDWSYRNLEISNENVAVPGYDIALSVNKTLVSGSWLASTPITRPKPDRIKSRILNETDSPMAGFADSYGFVTGPLASDKTGTLFGCQNRLCTITAKNQNVSLVSDYEISPGALTLWLSINKFRYAVAGIDGKVALLSKP